MHVIGLALATVGAFLLWRSALRLAEGNPTDRLPSWTNPPVVPRGAIALRALGAGLGVGGVSLVAPSPAWAGALALTIWGPHLVVHVAHNHRVRRQTRTAGPVS